MVLIVILVLLSHYYTTNVYGKTKLPVKKEFCYTKSCAMKRREWLYGDSRNLLLDSFHEPIPRYTPVYHKYAWL